MSMTRGHNPQHDEEQRTDKRHAALCLRELEPCSRSRCGGAAVPFCRHVARRIQTEPASQPPSTSSPAYSWCCRRKSPNE